MKGQGKNINLPSISSTLYVQIFRTNIVSAAFSSYVLALAKNSYEKCAQKMLVKLTPGLQRNCSNITNLNTTMIKRREKIARRRPALFRFHDSSKHSLFDILQTHLKRVFSILRKLNFYLTPNSFSYSKKSDGDNGTKSPK